jgi:hypothetical protein
MAADDLFPEKSKAREYEADEWAARWALDDAPRPEQYEVRVPAVAAALIWIALVDSVRRGSVTHPHAWDRFGRLTDVIQAPDDSVGLWLSGCMMKAFFRPAEEAPVHDTARDMFEDELIRALRSAR